MNKTTSTPHLLQSLRARLASGGSVLIVTHDFPDPDCLASALGMQELIRYWGIERVAIAYGGFVGRLENQTMVRLVGVVAERLTPRLVERYERIVVVDAVPGSGNVSLAAGVSVDFVVDHHLVHHRQLPNGIVDLRPTRAATSSIITQYLRTAGCPISKSLATALFYGMKTDTHHMRQLVPAEDMEIYTFLFDRIDHAMLAEIEDPLRTREYFRMVHDGLEAMAINGDVGYMHLPNASTPDHVAEMADFAARLRDLEWMICSAVVGDTLYFSVRSRSIRRAGPTAERIARRMHGTGGGHALRAAGQIRLAGRDHQKVVDAFTQSLHRVLRIKEGETETIL
jgi:nanoRNase/pAp phosphatase (c-di-AMP/oligoRNAs hydrolase)